MPCFSLKRAYFIVSSVISGIVLVGGFTLIITMRNTKDDNGNFEWARNLIAMVFTLWMPSPGESLKEIVESRNRNLQRLAEIQAISEKEHNTSSVGTNEFGSLRSDLNDTIRGGGPRHVNAFQELLNTVFKTTNNTHENDKPVENDIEMGQPETTSEQPVQNNYTEAPSVNNTSNNEKTEYKIQIEVVDD